MHNRPATATNSRRRATKDVPRGSPYSHASSIDPGFVKISLACIHTCPHCSCWASCIRFGDLFSRQRSFCFLYCDMHLRFRGCPVVLDIELYVSACYQKTCTVLLRARCLLMLLLLAADSKKRRCAVCDITFESTRKMERKQKNDFVPIKTPNNPAASNTCLLYTSPSPRD